ncbi:ABC transporter substrate-binding protein [Romeriopsis navalis]|nr:ABC transporter substrate-binding protein [Romeriopsis navalis]
MNTKSRLFAILLSLTCFSSGCTPKSATAPGNSDLTQANVCFSGNSGNQAVVWYAQDKGLFKKYGLDVKLTAITGGSSAAAAMIAGEMDFCQISGPAIVNAVVAEQDLVIIAGLFNTYVTTLIARPEIKTVDDLRGKSIAISKPGGASDTEVRIALKSLGLKPNKDVTVLAVGGQSARMVAMESGQIASTVVSPPNTLTARKRGYRELLDLASLNLPFQHTSLATTRAYLAKHPDVSQAFVKANVEAIVRMKQDPAGTKAVMAKYMLLDVKDDAAALDEAYTRLIDKALSNKPYPTLDGIQAILTNLATKNPAAAKVKPTDIADRRIIQDLNDSGFIDQLANP